MIAFTKELAIQVVKKALHAVAAFEDSADVTQFSFAHFNNYHKAAFMAELKQQVVNLKGDNYYYDVPLNSNDINDWNTIADCINYLLKYTSIFPGKFKDVENIVKNKIISTKSSKGKSKVHLLNLLKEGEGYYSEFKSSLRWDYKQNRLNDSSEFEVLRLIAVFLNTDGGHLIIGIDDGKKILGLEKDFSTLKKNNSDGFQLHLNNLLNKQFSKNVHRLLRIGFEQIDDNLICLVRIYKCNVPKFIKKDGKDIFPIRINGASQNLDIKEAIEYALDRWNSKTFITQSSKYTSPNLKLFNQKN